MPPLPGDTCGATKNPHIEADPCREFGSLTMLLALVTAVENGGHSSLQPAYRERYKGLFDTMEPDPNNVVNAVAAILERDNRAVAVLATKSPCHQSVSHVPLNVGHYVYVTQDGGLHFNETNSKDHSITVLEPIANASTQKHPQNDVTLVITKGTSHFDLISRKKLELPRDMVCFPSCHS